MDYEILLLFSEAATLNSRPEIVGPSEPATLAASRQPCMYDQKLIKEFKMFQTREVLIQRIDELVINLSEIS